MTSQHTTSDHLPAFSAGMPRWFGCSPLAHKPGGDRTSAVLGTSTRPTSGLTGHVSGLRTQKNDPRFGQDHGLVGGRWSQNRDPLVLCRWLFLHRPMQLMLWLPIELGRSASVPRLSYESSQSLKRKDVRTQVDQLSSLMGSDCMSRQKRKDTWLLGRRVSSASFQPKVHTPQAVSQNKTPRKLSSSSIATRFASMREQRLSSSRSIPGDVCQSDDRSCTRSYTSRIPFLRRGHL